jgi:hypothetical protein
MPCPEYTRLAGLCESKRKAYVYIRLNEEKVGHFKTSLRRIGQRSIGSDDRSH